MNAVAKPSVSLKSLVRGPQPRALRGCLFGPEGCGKSTFASKAPSPVFIATEDGTAQLDVVRFPKPERWEEVLESIRLLTEDEHDFKTLAVDTLDHAEPLIWQYVCEQTKVQTIEEVGGGYGKGYQAALDVWRKFLGLLETLQKQRGMNVILLAHSKISTFKAPDHADYDRYTMKLNDKAAGLIKEWCDFVLFANYETVVTKDARTKRTRGISTGARIIHTERDASYDAKNRHNLPPTLPLDWEEFERAVSAKSPFEAKRLVEEIRTKAKQLGGDFVKKADAFIKDNQTNAARLAQMNDRINGLLMEKEQNG